MNTQGKKPGEAAVKVVATNPNARRNVAIEDTYEAGLVLTGTEIKSIRQAAPNLNDAFVEVRSKKDGLEAFLLNAHIAPYTHGNIWNHDPLRPRKLLLHHHQLDKLFGAVIQKGMTIVPIQLYLRGGICKVEIGWGKGKKHHDRREDLKRKSADKEIAQAMRRGR